MKLSMSSVKKLSCLASAVVLSLSLFSVPVRAYEVGSSVVAFEASNTVSNTSISDTKDSSRTNRVRAVISGSVNISKPDETPSNGEEDGVLKAEDSEVLGSVNVQLEDTKKKADKGGVKFAALKVADVVKGEFVLSDEFKGAYVDLNNIKNANELEIVSSKLAKLYKESLNKDGKDEVVVEKGKGGIIVTDDKGFAEVKDLEVGVYLFYVLDPASYEVIDPFLISIPTYSEADGCMLYDIIVYPKHTPIVETEKGAPGTGVYNNSLKYALISVGCVALAGLVCIVSRGKKKEVI